MKLASETPTPYRARRAPKYQAIGKPPTPDTRTRIGQASDVWNLLRADLAKADVEHFVVLTLDAHHKLIQRHDIAKGCLSGVEVHPRSVFRASLADNAASIILAHNHPSGNPTPSSEDVAVTQRLKTCGEMFGIAILDHIILAGDGFVSMAERGWY